MKIIIKAEGDKDKIDMVLSNEEIDTPSFIDMIIEGEEYQVPIDDLYDAIWALKSNSGK